MATLCEYHLFLSRAKPFLEGCAIPARAMLRVKFTVMCFVANNVVARRAHSIAIPLSVLQIARSPSLIGQSSQSERSSDAVLVKVV